MWREDLVTFVVGCSFTFASALVAEGIRMAHQDAGVNVPMHRTNRRCASAGTGELCLFNLVDTGRCPTPITLREGVLEVEHNDVLPVTGTELPQTELAVLAESVSEARAD